MIGSQLEANWKRLEIIMLTLASEGVRKEANFEGCSAFVLGGCSNVCPTLREALSGESNRQNASVTKRLNKHSARELFCAYFAHRSNERSFRYLQQTRYLGSGKFLIAFCNESHGAK